MKSSARVINAALMIRLSGESKEDSAPKEWDGMDKL